MRFKTSAVLSATTGVLVADNKMEGVYELFNFLVGRPVWTHELLCFNNPVKGFLLNQFPFLQDVTIRTGMPQAMEDCAAVVERYGEYLDVAGPETPIMPDKTWADVLGDKEVIVVGA